MVVDSDDSWTNFSDYKDILYTSYKKIKYFDGEKDLIMLVSHEDFTKFKEFVIGVQHHDNRVNILAYNGHLDEQKRQSLLNYFEVGQDGTPESHSSNEDNAEHEVDCVDANIVDVTNKVLDQASHFEGFPLNEEGSPASPSTNNPPSPSTNNPPSPSTNNPPSPSTNNPPSPSTNNQPSPSTNNPPTLSTNDSQTASERDPYEVKILNILVMCWNNKYCRNMASHVATRALDVANKSTYVLASGGILVVLGLAMKVFPATK